MTSENDAPPATEVPDVVARNNDVPHVFCQMDALRPFHDEFVWKEVRRWVRFEEELEEDGNRWSKPHVSSLCMQYLTELHMIVTANPVFLDLPAKSMSDIVDLLLQHWRDIGLLQTLLGNHVRAILLKKHKHKTLHKHMLKLHLPKIHSESNLAVDDEDDDRESSDNLQGLANKGYENNGTEEAANKMENGKSASGNGKEPLSYEGEINKKFKRKIPPGSEVMNIMIGEIEELKTNLCAFVRLAEATDIGMITEVDLPTRFLFILLVPKGNLEPAMEAGRCMGTLITDEIFREIAYKADNELDILAGIQEFTSQTTVLPPGCWDPAVRIEPPENLPTKEFRKEQKGAPVKDKTPNAHEDPTLQRTGRLFGGLIEDIKRKVPWYISDYKDGIHIQCLATFIYLFLATLTPNITFGGLMGIVTDNYMGPMECILAAAITGVVFALFSGQPLNILGSTGPMLVLEMILYKFCKDRDWDYMPFRCWVGLWVAFLIFLMVALDLSALVRYITKFTEEAFACLIALIFIYQAFENLYHLEQHHPVHFHVPESGPDHCTCNLPNFTLPLHRYTYDNMTNSTNITSDATSFGAVEFSSGNNLVLQDTDATKELFLPDNCSAFGGNLTGSGCETEKYVPDVFFFSVILFCGTFGIAVALVNFKSGRFGSATFRRTVSDFGVLLAIVLMVLLDALLGVPTPKLEVPAEFKPTNPARGWFINPMSDKNPIWLIPAAIIPALLTTILVFMDQQITAVIVNRPEHKLRKGGGYHLDMLVLGILIVVLSLFGLPWYVAATVSALAHIISLKKETECTAPGEKPTFLGVREQRLTALLVGILSGFAVLITSVLKYIPMPVLYGVFLYMGVAALNGMQLVQRIAIIFIPPKYQPDYKYLRHVPLMKVHLFTAIQIGCLVVLWVVKSIKSISIIFPLMVLATCFVRKAMNCIFTEHDLKWLDGSHGGKKQKTAPPTIHVYDEEEGSHVSNKKRCISLPASVNMGFRPSIHSNTDSHGSNQNIFGKRDRKISLMELPEQGIYRRKSEMTVIDDFHTSMCSTHRALSQESVDGIRHQSIFDKRKTRRPSLLSVPPSTN